MTTTNTKQHQPTRRPRCRLTRAGALAAICVALVGLVALGAHCSPWQSLEQPAQQRRLYGRQHFQQPRASLFAARRAADDSRPLLRFAAAAADAQEPTLAESQATPTNEQVVVGRFRAPAPERVHKQRVPSASQFAAHTMSASYRVSDATDGDSEKVVHGIGGASTNSNSNSNNKQQQSIQRTVGAKIMVSDEGLNYPPSKLSADIHGNVAEIVTAPPEAVESDFLYPKSSRFSSSGRR